jgi:SAM-dependent methyltransferase
MICILLFKRCDLSPYYEGFDQDKPFVYKKDHDAKDDFYAEIYDQLQNPDERNTYILDKTVEMTLPTPKNCSFLDIGSNTGSFMDLLYSRGFKVTGLEPSQAMVNYSKKRNPKLSLKCGSIDQSMNFEKGSFTHIISNGLTFYEFQDKRLFFQNCLFWLVPGGYLILHLVDPTDFDPIIPGGKPPLMKSPQTYSSTRITDTMIDFIDFKYKASFDFSNMGKDHDVRLKETFTDEITKNIRQNEFSYKMEPLQDVLKMASANGFIVKGQVNLEQCTGDSHQYLIVLERP